MTGGDIPIGDFTYPVTSDLSAKQFYAVYMTSTTLAVCPTGNYGMLGILQDNPNATSTGVNKTTVGTVRELGHSKAWIYYLSGTVVAGSPLRVSTTTPGMLEIGTVASDVIVAIACEAASTTANSIIEVALTARTAQGTSARSGQLAFTIPVYLLNATGAVFTTPALGFSGNIVDMYAIASGTYGGAATSSATAALTLGITSGTANVTGLTIPATQLTAAHVIVPGTVMTSTGKGSIAASGAFGPTDTLMIYNTQGATQFAATNTAVITVYVVYN